MLLKTFLLTASLFGVTAFVAALKLQSQTKSLRIRLAQARADLPQGRVDLTRAASLPQCVQRYLQRVLVDGQRMIASVHAAHRGTFNVSEGEDEKWRPFSSDQLSVMQRPGFDWNARIDFALGVPMFVRDAYVLGEGMLSAKLFGLVSMAYLRDGREIAAGQLMRFLAEVPLYPTMLLPGEGVQWEESDANTAFATLRDGNVEVTLAFHFDERGLIAAVEAAARGRTVGKTTVPTPWAAYGKRKAVLAGNIEHGPLRL